MTKAKKHREAKNFITRELQQRGAGRIDAMNWGQGPRDLVPSIYRSTISLGREKSIFTFTKYELLEDYGSKQWKKELRGHVGDILWDLRYE